MSQSASSPSPLGPDYLNNELEPANRTCDSTNSDFRKENTSKFSGRAARAASVERRGRSTITDGTGYSPAGFMIGSVDAGISRTSLDGSRATVTTRQISASKRRRGRNLVLAALGFTLAGFAWFAMAWAMLQLQAARCPDAAFFWASNQAATALQVIPLALPALSVGFLIASWVLPERSPPRNPGVVAARERRQMVKLSLILLAFALPISFAASLCQFCLTPQAIAYQAAPWSGFRPYSWEDVTSVAATCHYRRGRYAGWAKQLIVVMRDGASIDLMT